MVTEQFASLHEIISNIAATEGPPEEALKATARDFLRILLDPGSIAMLRIIVAESLKDAAFGNCLSESAPERTAAALDRKSVVSGTSVSVRVDLDVRRSIKQKKQN